MSKYVLFSPLGFTDPCREFRDGAMLHILRHYPVDKMYLYISYEIENKIKLDLDRNEIDRYTFFAKKIREDIEIDYIYTGEKNPQLFNVYYDKLKSEFKRIRTENPDAVILYNLSSGTPSLKGLIPLMVQENEFDQLLQVESPHKGSGKDIKHFSENTLDDWNIILDMLNEEENNSSKRINYVKDTISDFRKAILHKELLVLCENYDYDGAFSLINHNQDIFPEDIKNLIYYSHYITKMKYEEAIKIYNNSLKSLCLYGDNRELKHSERFQNVHYYLSADLKLKSGSYDSYCMYFTPINENLLFKIINKKAKLSSSFSNREIIKQNSRGEYVLMSSEKINQMASYLCFDCKRSVSTKYFIKIYKYICQLENKTTDDYFTNMKEICLLQEEYRNKIVHTMIYPKNEDIIKIKTYKYNIEILMKEVYNLKAEETALFETINERVKEQI